MLLKKIGVLKKICSYCKNKFENRSSGYCSPQCALEHHEKTEWQEMSVEQTVVKSERRRRGLRVILKF